MLASLEDGVTYKPASSIKVLIHLFALTQVQNGLINLNTPIPTTPMALEVVPIRRS